MHYKKFIIRNYRAITSPLEIDVGKHSLMPIIGVNECGKTTILHAIFAFDYSNDKLNDNGRHLRDTRNLYRTSSKAGHIAAEIELHAEDIVEILDDLTSEGTLAKPVAAYRRLRKKFPNSLIIVRNLETKRYELEFELFSHKVLNDLIARQLLRRLPYILYFDDFRDSIEEKIEITRGPQGEAVGWLAILEQLFKHASEDFSVFSLPGLEERERKSVLSKVKKHLTSTLTKEWQHFRLDESDALRISIDYVSEGASTEPPRSFLKLEIIETDSKGEEHFFYIRDRSKGFFWFFNFVMKLEFNPKVLDGDASDTIYLLDEPGSYLHASAQSKLCVKLKNLSSRNRVIYCTHSHYLLDPAVIPLSTIRVADKDGEGNVRLVPLHEHKGSILERRSAFQPVVDALQIKPFLLDLTHDGVIITEGVYDYYALEMMKQGRTINVLPSVGADSVQYYISLMLAWRVQFCVLWDNDKAGRKAKKKAEEVFGEEISRRHFFLLDGRSGTDTILQDLFSGSDLRMIRDQLQIPGNASFEKTIASLFFSQERPDIIGKLSKTTRERFEKAFELARPS